MVADRRITYRRRHSYRTASNIATPVKTPGGVLVAHYVQKKGKGVKCGDCGSKLAGIPARRPNELAKAKKHSLRVSRAYGGSRCGKCVKQRVVRAFLVEEQKIVKKVMQAKKASK